MGTVSVKLRYLTGLKRPIFSDARLWGSWDAQGRASQAGTETAMQAITAEDGYPAFEATVLLDESGVGQTFRWGVYLDTLSVSNLWGIPTERNDPDDDNRVVELVLEPGGGARQVEDYYFTYARRLGARKVFAEGCWDSPGLRFSVWAPHAKKVEVVFGDPAQGYVADDGTGIDPDKPVLCMKPGGDGIWSTEVLPDFASWEGAPYMYRIENAQGRTVYRTDVFSRQQIGRGTIDPQTGAKWDKTPSTLDGTKSCSLVVGLDSVARDFSAPNVRVSEAEFWANELTPGLPVRSRFTDLVIYELHVGALGYGQNRAGNLQDAIDLLPHLSDLGVEAVELLPMSEFSGLGWGYGDSHLFVVETPAGGRDQYLHFVRECHRRGIAVIQDVVYNHFDPNADRAEWAYDSDAPEENQYYWYEGLPGDYPAYEAAARVDPIEAPPGHGGYLDNGSTGYSPRFDEPWVRRLIISSAAAFMEECHVDGLRVDLTQAMHRDNVLHADGRSVGRANQFGQKVLREWSRTLRMIKPAALLIAEDHSDWDKVTQVPEIGGLGFDATWYAVFFHNLIGDSEMARGKARLLALAGMGDDRGLDMDQFAGVLYGSKYNKVLYHASHDEEGNDEGTRRTLRAAVNDAPLVGVTRAFAEARVRFAFSLALFSAGTPMFFMGEEVGAQKPYTYSTFMQNREDILGLRAGEGAKLFRFYQEAIRFSRRHPAVRVQGIDIVHVNGNDRVIAFRRSAGTDELMVVGSLNNATFESYVVATDSWRLPDGVWREIFNSNAATYGGDNLGNFGRDLPVTGGRLELRIPANTVLVLGKV